MLSEQETVDASYFTHMNFRQAKSTDMKCCTESFGNLQTLPKQVGCRRSVLLCENMDWCGLYENMEWCGLCENMDWCGLCENMDWCGLCETWTGVDRMRTWTGVDCVRTWNGVD